jgi:hypothetical protein
MLVVALAVALLASCVALGVRLARDAAPSEATATAWATRKPTAIRATRAPSPTPSTPRSGPTATEVSLAGDGQSPTAYPTSDSVPSPTPAVTLVELDLSEEEVNAIVQKAVAGRTDVPISDLRVTLEPGLMVASGTVKISILSVDLQLLLTVRAEGGKAVPEIVDIRSGGRPLTGFLRDQVEAIINPYLGLWLQTETGVYVEKVVIEEGHLRMAGRYK